MFSCFNQQEAFALSSSNKCSLVPFLMGVILLEVRKIIKKLVFQHSISIILMYWDNVVPIHLQHFRGLSFPTTSSVGSNAAIIHYKPETETCAELDPDCIYLFDSGAQVCENIYSG